MLSARSPEECHLYMELHPCGCGEPLFEWSRHHQEQRAERQQRLRSIYEGVCPACRTPRRFEFEVTGELPEPPAYGGPAPSRIIDPSEFLMVSAELAAAVPADPAPLDPAARDDRGEAIEMAIAALDEVLKFMPDGAETVPADAFHSEAGRAAYQRDPGRYDRRRLRETRSGYERIRTAYATVPG